MSFRPVDMQVILPQVTDAGRMQAVQNNQNNVAQNLFAEKLQKETEQRQEQVQKVVKVELGKITRDQEKEEQAKKQKKNKRQANLLASDDTSDDLKKEAEKKTSNGFSPTLGNNLDITS